MALSTQPYKGARDFYPEDKRLQKYMFGKIRQAVERFGYEEYDAPILESLELYLAKTGEEIVSEQTYNFTDRGGREVVIRPEMTPSVSRMVAAKRQELAYPLRWYSIPNLWRYERPQRGRLREHWQLNVDLFGVKTVEAELELMALVDALYKSYGATPDMYTIQINSRQLIDFILYKHLGLDKTAGHSVAKLIDRMHKMPLAAFQASIDEILTADQRSARITEQLLDILQAAKITDLPLAVQQHASVQELQEVLQRLQASGISNAQFDPTIMRGFDYYTGIVFEVADTHPENNRSMMGGGRYDGLVGLFGVEPVATVGFGLGDATLANFLELHELLPPLTTETQLYIACIGEVIAAAGLIADDLRADGFNVALDLSGRKLGDQLKTAEKKSINQVLIIGASELNEGLYVYKDLSTGEQLTLSLNDIKAKLTKVQ